MAFFDERPGAHQANVMAQLGRHDSHAARRCPKCRLRNKVPGRRKPPLALPFGQGSANHDPVRIEGVDPADAGDGKGPAGPLHQTNAGRVARQLALGHISGGQRPPLGAVALDAGREKRRLARGDGLLRLSRKTRPSSYALEVAHAATAAARPTIGNERDVAQLSGGSVRTKDQAAVAHDGAAQTLSLIHI